MTATIRAEWHTVDQAQRHWKAQCSGFVTKLLRAGTPVVVTVTPLELAKSDRQRRFFHGVVLKEISEQVSDADGSRHAIKVWKEYFRDRFLGVKAIHYTNPRTGEVVTREEPVSTEGLSVRAYSQLIEQVMAEGVELGVRFSCPDWESYEEIR